MKHILSITLATAFTFFGSAQGDESSDNKIKVACIGDSITVGVGAGKPASYPAQLRSALGDKYSVSSYGKSGATLLKKGGKPYWEQEAFKTAVQRNHDIVVILLGANDAKTKGSRKMKGGNWSHKADFKNDYIDLVKVFQNLKSKPKVYICYPVPASENKWHISGDAIKHEIIPFIDEVAKETNAEIIDLHSIFEGKSNLIPDGVHPNAEGAKLMAEKIAESLQRSGAK